MPWSDPAIFRPTGVVIVQTAFVPQADRVTFSHAEITIAPDHAPKAKRTVLVTTDPLVYARALGHEGTSQQFDVAWHPGHTPNGRSAQVITRLEPCGVAVEAQR